MNRTSWTINVAVDFWRSRKGLIAGRDGRDLFLVSVAWSTEARLDGLVVAEALETIATQAGIALKAAKAAVPKIVASGLWDETGEGWMIHDYGQWQMTAAERDRQRTGNAARQARYRSHKTVDTPDSNALRNGQSDASVTPSVTQHITGSKSKSKSKSKEEDLLTSENPLSSSSRGVWGDDDDRTNLDPRIQDALIEVGTRRHKAAEQAGQIGRDADRHLQTCVANALIERLPQAVQALADHPDATVDQLADLVQPPRNGNGKALTATEFVRREAERTQP